MVLIQIHLHQMEKIPGMFFLQNLDFSKADEEFVHIFDGLGVSK